MPTGDNRYCESLCRTTLKTAITAGKLPVKPIVNKLKNHPTGTYERRMDTGCPKMRISFGGGRHKKKKRLEANKHHIMKSTTRTLLGGALALGILTSITPPAVAGGRSAKMLHEYTLPAFSLVNFGYTQEELDRAAGMVCSP
jgi:hypothetical protein